MNSLIVVFKESLIISAFVNIVKAFASAYENSGFKRCVKGIAVCFRESGTYKWLSRYANKKPYYRYSFVYKIVMAIAGLVDMLFGAINSVALKWLSGSKAAESTVNACKSTVNIKLYGFGLLFMSIPIGSLIALIYAGSVNIFNIAVCWVVFVIGLLCVVFALCGGALESSFVLRAAAKFMNLILGED